MLFFSENKSGCNLDNCADELLKKDKLLSSLIWVSCENLAEFHILDEVMFELYNELPTKVLA
jgi:hypothetical protein